MIDDVNNYLVQLSIENEKILFERFGTVPKSDENDVIEQEKESVSNVTVCVDGDDFEFDLSSSGNSILDAAMEAGADVPFSCKGGVCCVCKAKVLEGDVVMDQNFSLSEDEVDQGFILTCQAHPSSDKVVVDFDEI